MEEFFDSVIESFSIDILRFIRAHTRNLMDAEDLTQEVFLRAYAHQSALQQVHNQKAWLFRVAVNVYRDHARKNRRHPITYLGEVPDVAYVDGPEHLAVDKENAVAVMHLVLQLPEKLKDVVLLHYAEELSITEIAYALKTPVNTVKTRLHRARNLLRERGGTLRDEA